MSIKQNEKIDYIEIVKAAALAADKADKAAALAADKADKARQYFEKAGEKNGTVAFQAFEKAKTDADAAAQAAQTAQAALHNAQCAANIDANACAKTMHTFAQKAKFNLRNANKRNVSLIALRVNNAQFTFDEMIDACAIFGIETTKSSLIWLKGQTKKMGFKCTVKNALLGSGSGYKLTDDIAQVFNLSDADADADADDTQKTS